MPISVEDVLGATEYRSMSRAGRMTESLSSKTRSTFHAKVSKKKLDRAAEDPAAARSKPKSEKQALKLLSVAEVADVDATEVDKQVRAALPLDLIDERVDPLCSSGRDHPEVKAKAEMIVSLEKEIAFHKALEAHHGGVQTAASRQSAEAVAVERTRKDREEASRRANALGLGPSAIDVTTTATAAVNANDAASLVSPSPVAKSLPSGPSHHNKKPGSLTPGMLRTSASSPVAKRAMTPAVSPLSNPTAANRCSSPAFAAKGDRFGSPSHEITRAPPVGHYRPRFNIVESSSPRSRFPKNRRVLNPTFEPAFRGDRMSPEERSLAEAAAMSPTRRLHASNSDPNLNGTLGSNQNASATFASIVLPSQQLPPAPASGQQQPVVRGRASSPSFANQGRDAPVMTRGASTPAPGQQRVGGHSEAKPLSHRSRTPGFANDSVVRPRGPAAGLDFSRQIGREERERQSVGPSATSEKIADTASMPLRNGSPLNKRTGGGSAFAFDGYASRDQVSRAKDRRPEDEGKRFYDRKALDQFKFSRPTAIDFGRSPSRAQARGGMPTLLAGGDSQGMDGTPPEKLRPHSPTFNMDKQTTRPPTELHQTDLQYDFDDHPVRSVPRAAKIGTSAGHDPAASSPSRSRIPKPAEQPRYLPSHEELDSPQVRRKLARSIDFGKSVDRTRAATTSASTDEPLPIPAERLEQAYDYLQPAKRGDPRIGTHVSRNMREAVASSPPLTSAVDLAIVGDASNKPSLKLGYVNMSRMTERDRHTGNHFANESRTITKLFDKSPARSSQQGSEQRKQRAAATDSSRSRMRQQ